MIKRLFVLAGVLFAISISEPLLAARATWRVSQFENILGTSLEFRFAASSDREALLAEAAALGEIERLNRILSGYNKESEFARWLTTSGQPIAVSPDLFEVLRAFDEWRTRSQGALDPSAQVASLLWQRAATQNRTPTASELQAAIAQIAAPHYRLDASTYTATRLGDAPLILNSFAKSYIAARAAEVAMQSARLSGAVVNIGGDLVIRGALPETVLIANPKADAENDEPIARVVVRDASVATSGSYRRGVEVDGRRYSHIIDPRSAQPVDAIISATVVAPGATDAGALATALCVLSPEESLALVASIPGAECLLIKRNGERVESKGWHSLEVPAPLRRETPAKGSAAAQQIWDQTELVINFELARIDSPGYRRPYVAVWVEDKDHFPVRTLALWYQKPRWLPDLRAWSRADRLRSMAENTDLTTSVSSATRPAGKYSLRWDGKDNQGKFVKPGGYTVYVEAAREHGSYQLLKQEINFNGTPQKFNLDGGVEVAGVSLDYHQKTH